ncbi:MAG: GH92 family glycosyl hydrolase [Flavobacteriales bacterium]|nr:GH92 family glycosyl hydrolase [Flavobacteriales bacterium]
MRHAWPRTLLPALLLGLSSATMAQRDLARTLVNPFIGTGGHGHTFPGACVPNGLVQLSPDTRPDGMMDWDGCGGYHHSDSLIYGFSHTHLSGTGVADLCDVLIMPMSGAYSFDPKEYRSRFSHANESANAGYYRVLLDDERTVAEMTTTARTGVHRYTMPQDKDQYLVLDLAHRDRLLASRIHQEGLEIIGERRSASWARDQRMFFCIRIGRPSGPVGIGITYNADSTKAAIGVKREDAGPIIVKVGVSAVSVEGARANLEAEVPGWDFDAVRAQAETAWNAKLGKVQVEGGTPAQQRVFYTALYHCYVAPYVFNDVDGRYRGMDGQVHQADHNVYTVFSLWDTFRGLHPLMTILEPDMTRDWIRTFLLHYQQGGRLPVWELWGNETDCMIGYHSVSVIADAHRKGIRGFDEQLALKAMRASADRDEPGLNAYRTKGFISSEDQSESVSKTLEYAYNDACIARYQARLEGMGGDAHPPLAMRATSYRNLYDPSTGFFRARRNGGFVGGFDPFEVNFNFTEANAWQYSLFVPQDIEDLIALHGGDAALAGHLDKLFAANSATSGREQADITGLIGQYAHGNEPSHHMAYLYNRVGRPERTRALVKRIMDEQYHDAPDGLSGNEDCGQMSAWYVLSALGLYPISPGIDDSYELGHPLFDRAEVRLPNGRTWSTAITAPEAWGATLPADTAHMLRKVPARVHHGDLLAGGVMHFRADRSPYPTFERMPLVLDGAYVGERRTTSCDRPGAPVIEAASAAFMDSLVVVVRGKADSIVVVEGGQTFRAAGCTPFTLHRSATVTAHWSSVLAPVTARYTRTEGGLSIALDSKYSNQYAAGGDRALIDGLRGSPDFRTGEWQGYHGQDVLITIDLGAVKKLKRVGLGMLQDENSWIWYPELVDVAWSTNGRQWSSTVLKPGVDRKAQGALTMDLWSGAIGKKARYIKVMAKNGGPCPDWHKGKGGTTWIFLDEVLIDME